MSRTHDVAGLHNKALSFLNENAVRTEVKICPTCGNTEGGEVIRDQYDSFVSDVFASDMFDEDNWCKSPLWEYTLKDGRKVCEVVQAEPWNSGPTTYLCLQDSKTGKRLFEWSDEEMHN